MRVLRRARYGRSAMAMRAVRRRRPHTHRRERRARAPARRKRHTPELQDPRCEAFNHGRPSGGAARRLRHRALRCDALSRPKDRRVQGGACPAAAGSVLLDAAAPCRRVQLLGTARTSFRTLCAQRRASVRARVSGSDDDPGGRGSLQGQGASFRGAQPTSHAVQARPQGAARGFKNWAMAQLPHTVALLATGTAQPSGLGG